MRQWLSDGGATTDPSVADIANRIQDVADPRRRSTPRWVSLLHAGEPNLHLASVRNSALDRAVSTRAAVGLMPAEPVVLAQGVGEDRERAIDCLAAAIHYEAANEPLDGQEAVAQVVLNRLQKRGFPKSVCGVVFQGSYLSTGCQFTFTCDGSLHRRPSPAAWNRAREIAKRALDGHVMAEVGSAINYHAYYVRPYWSATLQKVARIGAHIFYEASPFAPSAAVRGFPRIGRTAEPALDIWDRPRSPDRVASIFANQRRHAVGAPVRMQVLAPLADTEIGQPIVIMSRAG